MHYDLGYYILFCREKSLPKLEMLHSNKKNAIILLEIRHRAKTRTYYGLFM